MSIENPLDRENSPNQELPPPPVLPENSEEKEEDKKEWDRSTVEYVKGQLEGLHKYKPTYIFLTECSAIPVGFVLKEAWKNAYPDEKLPKFYRIDPKQVMDIAEENEGKKRELEEFFRKRIKDKDGMVFVYDEASVSGRSPGIIVNILTDPKWYGLSEDIKVRNIKRSPRYGGDRRESGPNIAEMPISYGPIGYKLTIKHREDVPFPKARIKTRKDLEMDMKNIRSLIMLAESDIKKWEMLYCEPGRSAENKKAILETIDNYTRTRKAYEEQIRDLSERGYLGKIKDLKQLGKEAGEELRAEIEKVKETEK